MFLVLIFYDSERLQLDHRATREEAEACLRSLYADAVEEPPLPPMPADADPVSFFNEHTSIGVAFITELNAP